MADHEPILKKESAFTPVPQSAEALDTRPFAPQPTEVAEPTPEQPLTASAPAPLSIFAPAAGPPPIQPKLTIGAPNDPYEQEADRVAKEVVQRIHSGAAAPPNFPIQRHTAEEAEDTLQAKRVQPQAIIQGNASNELESAVNQARGGGHPLDQTLQKQMGQAMGADFSGVKIHADTQADHLNRSIQAKAFTTGQDIFFRQGAYQPSNRSGQELIAHELTHVVQQQGKSIKRQTNKIQRHGNHHHPEEEHLQRSLDSRESGPRSGCQCANCGSQAALTGQSLTNSILQRQVDSFQSGHHRSCPCPSCGLSQLKIQRKQESAHAPGCSCPQCTGKNDLVQAKFLEFQTNPLESLPILQLAAYNPSLNIIQRHASWEHKLIGDLDPDELSQLGASRDLQELERQDDVNQVVRVGNKDVRKENILHILKQEINRLAVFQKNPPKPWSGTGRTKQDEEKRLREASFERANKTNEQLLREDSLFGWGQDSSRAKKASPKTLHENQGQGQKKEDSQWQVDLLEIKSEHPGNSNHKVIVVTYGEMNTLADFYGSLDELKKTDPDSLYAIVQGVRQESLKKLSKLYGEISGIIKKSSEEASGHHVWNSRTREKQKKKTNEALGLSTTDFQDAAPVGNVTAELQQMRAGGVFGRFSNKKKQIDEGIIASGDKSTAYSATLARNACHFAPESWLSWGDYHEKARNIAKRAAEAGKRANELNTDAQNANQNGLDAIARTLQKEADRNLEEKLNLANEALVTNGFGDHYLQDSYAGGHLINKTQIMMFFTEWMDKQEKAMDGVIDQEWRRIQEVAYNQSGIVDENQYDKTRVGQQRNITVSGQNQSVSRARNPQSIENIEEGGWQAKFQALGLKLPTSMTDPSKPEFQLLVWWQDIAMKSKTSARTQTVGNLAKKTGFDMRTLVVSVRKLLDDRIVRFDSAEKSGSYLDPSWIGEQRLKDIKVVLRDDYVPKTNLIGQSESEKKFKAMQKGYKTAQQSGDFATFKQSKEFQSYQQQGAAVSYNNYLTFMKSSYLQASTNVLHDKFCKEGLEVYPDNSDTEKVFRVYGDDAMLQKGSSEGLKHSGVTAKKSKQAILDIVTGVPPESTQDIAARFPSWVKPPKGSTKVTLAEWHNGGSLKKLCFDEVFPQMPNLKKLAGIVGGDLGQISKDEETHQGEMF